MSAAIALRDRPLVERVAAAPCDLLERRREVRVAEDVAGRRRMAAGQERGRRGRIAREQRFDVLPLVRDDLADRVAVARVADRRLERCDPA